MKMKTRAYKTYSAVTEVIYTLAAVLLTACSLLMILHSIAQFFPKYANYFPVPAILHSLSALIISIAIIDIAKYLIEEELFRIKELRVPSEARKVLTRVIVIIAIAISLEGLVNIFRAGEMDITLLPYPAILVLTSIAAMLSLGIYQKYSVNTENELIMDIYRKEDRLHNHERRRKSEEIENKIAYDKRIRQKKKEEAEDQEEEESRQLRLKKMREQSAEGPEKHQ